MSLNISKTLTKPLSTSILLLAENAGDFTEGILTNEELSHLRLLNDTHQQKQFIFNRLEFLIFVKIISPEKNQFKTLENLRLEGDKFQAELNNLKLSSIAIETLKMSAKAIIAFIEGLALGSYRFNKYFSNKNDKINHLKDVLVVNDSVSENQIKELKIILDAVFKARDLVNEPANKLSAVKLAEAMKQMAADAAMKVEIFNKKKIESLKMGGLLSVNAGSVEPPTFTVLEWKPENAVNSKPLVFVGKGVVFDTGGYNIKTGSGMENMKCDMGGAAMVASAIYAAALKKLPVHIIALIPATDNRVSSNAYVTGDIITMHNGMTVEIINTDAEGRLILADALSYAQKLDPLLVINAATLTGSAMRAIGKYGIVAMHAEAAADMETLKNAGEAVYERIAEFPFWDEYGELMKSEIADLKNAGGTEAGMITAGKFLENFTAYPFIHMDIAGVAFAEKRDDYRGLGGTGYGVRLIYHFIKSKFNLTE
jgi:leucyl aminopeptidase